MIHSFRLRLTLLSVLLSGAALAAFGLGAWWRIRSLRLHRLDSDVRTYAERESSRTRDAADWQRTEASIVSELGVRSGQDLILLVQDREGRTVYQSSHWPAGLAADLPWPAPPTRKAANQDRPPAPPRLDGENPAPGDEPRTQPRDEDPGPQEPPPEPGPPAVPPVSVAISRAAEDRQWRVGLAVTDSARIALGADAASIEGEMGGIREAFLLALPLTLVLIGAGGWVFSSRAMHPLRKLVAATRRVSAEGLDRRIAIQGEDREFLELIQVYNRMLERLERSFRQAYRFSADAAHELKTPLAILQGQIERILQTADDGSSLQVELSSVLDEVRRLSTISGKLLLLAQADAGKLSLQRAPFDLSQVLTGLVEDTRMLAPHLQVDGEIFPGLTVAADGALLVQVLHNLVSNAIKYNVEGGWIRIAATIRARRIEVAFANASTGISPAEREKIFHRFYRASSARDRQREGVGLGLSVAREIARAHGGDLTLSAADERSVQFLLLLPMTNL
jgi:signal transduction histidine kinase